MNAFCVCVPAPSGPPFEWQLKQPNASGPPAAPQMDAAQPRRVADRLAVRAAAAPAVLRAERVAEELVADDEERVDARARCGRAPPPRAWRARSARRDRARRACGRSSRAGGGRRRARAARAGRCRRGWPRRRSRTPLADAGARASPCAGGDGAQPHDRRARSRRGRTRRPAPTSVAGGVAGLGSLRREGIH